MIMRLFLLLSTLFFAFGCSKPKTDQFMFDCVVFDEKTNTGVGNASIVMKVQRASGGFNPTWETVGAATTDATGRFYIEVDKEVFYAYRLEITHPQHFYTELEISPDDVPISHAYENTFVLEPKAWVFVHLQNQNASQAVTVSIDGVSNGCSECCTGNNTILQGAAVDTTLICLVFGAEDVEISGTYLDVNSVVHVISETQLVAPFDTASFTIVY